MHRKIFLNFFSNSLSWKFLQTSPVPPSLFFLYHLIFCYSCGFRIVVQFVHQPKFLLSTCLRICSEILAINRQKLRFTHCLPKPFNMRCSKLPTPKLDPYFRPYIQNTVCKLFSQVSTVAFLRF